MEKLDKSYSPWEYVVRTLQSDGDAILTAQLDSEGEQEWELVAFDFRTGRAIFKRRKHVDAAD